eukprot:TRINITY_DN24648_c0_g1_i1.p1 TRINITY_DN24648_c0_g1~~TRINITY_DN24648_c0_g1_i1.p1  ORF type:complete len:579 (-),score=88.19 TRINITY_DN24648_c0_g1_i1:196-1932(-)
MHIEAISSPVKPEEVGLGFDEVPEISSSLAPDQDVTQKEPQEDVAPKRPSLAPQQKSGWLMSHFAHKSVAPSLLVRAAAGACVGKLFWRRRFVELTGSDLKCWSGCPERSGSSPELLLAFPLNEVDQVDLHHCLCTIHCRSPQSLVHFHAVSQGEAEAWALAIKESVGFALSSSLPSSWDVQQMLTMKQSTKRLVHKSKLHDVSMSHVQNLVDQCYICKTTRDRHNHVVPFRLQLKQVIKVQNGAAWADYSRARVRIAQEASGRGIDLSTAQLEPGGVPPQRTLEQVPVLTSKAQAAGLEKVLAPTLDSSCNEQWLFHGTTFAGVKGISDEEFRLDFAGSHRGTMYGNGVYLAECTSKADEYAEEDDDGFCYMLLCRASLGRVWECSEKRPPRDVLVNCKAQGYDSLCGDRWTAVGTFREFIFYDPNCVYPAFILRYKRWYEAKLCEAIHTASQAEDQAMLSLLFLHAVRLCEEYPIEDARYRLTQLLSTIDGALTVLSSALSDKRLRVRRAALRILLQWASNSASKIDTENCRSFAKHDMSHIVAVLRLCQSDPVNEIRHLSLEVLQKLGEDSTGLV